jgi:outer membrane protein TolC
MKTDFKSNLSILLLLAAACPAVGQTPGGDRPKVNGPLSVQQAVETAQRNNLGIQAMQAEERATQQETKATAAMTKPQLSANTYLSAGTMSNILGSAPGVTPTNALVAPSKRFANQNLTLMVPLYTGGRLGSMVKAASERERASSANVGSERAATSLMVKDAYYRALLADEMVKVAQARIEAGRAMAENVRALFEAGKGIEASVSRANAELADAQRMLTSAQNDRAKMLLELRTAMGVDLSSDITLSDTLTFASPPGDVNGSLADAAKVRPELLAARARIEATRAEVEAAKGSQRPQVYGGVMADAFASREMGNGGGATVGLTLSFPLLDSGQRRAEVARAEAMRQRAEAELKNTELAVANQVRQAWLDVDTASQNYRTAQAAVIAAQQAYEVVTLRVQSQKSVLVEQLDALAALTQARSNLAQALYEHSSALARLQRAIGRP